MPSSKLLRVHGTLKQSNALPSYCLMLHVPGVEMLYIYMWHSTCDGVLKKHFERHFYVPVHLKFLRNSYEVVSESSGTVVVMTASVKEDGIEGQGHTCANLSCEIALSTRIVLYTGAFQTSHFVLSAMDVQIDKCVCMKFCVNLSKSATAALEIIHEAF
jgi:hypothetical protein